MLDKTYNIRVSFKHGNAITLDLKGCGSLYIKPYKDYYFVNAPITFVNYLAQLKRVGITYIMTNNKKGCYQEIDLTQYNLTDPRFILTNLRQPIVTAPIADKVIDERPIVLASDDLIVKEDTTVDVNTNIDDNSTVVTSTNTSTIEETEEETEEDSTITYTESMLSRLSKTDLLSISAKLGIDELSDINTKREIREAILKATK